MQQSGFSRCCLRICLGFTRSHRRSPAVSARPPAHPPPSLAQVENGRVYCLPDMYEVQDRSLADIQYVLNPTFTRESTACGRLWCMHASDCGPSCPTCNCPRLAPSPATVPGSPPAPRPPYSLPSGACPAWVPQPCLLAPLHFAEPPFAALLPTPACHPPPGAAEDVAKLDSGVSWARALDGSEYMPGLVGLNNLKLTDYANVVVQALIRVHPIR